ncbi:aldose 1-epimerase [Polaribacter sargassicola]|uniref:aldose 1-epimerase n=1 Tax=Polaribacter sargassicola TaxID=2836891 RepID=UPI001F3AD923|nr:aldose 1-epimerase [Polaribacter sp. DS7-9]
MYKINHIKETNILEITTTDKTVFGKIYLNQGASLQELTLNKSAIIQDLTPLEYQTTYASSILFPFANRIKDGLYSFDNKEYQLEKNQEEEQNALHGFVYNKTFTVLSKEVSKTEATITLEYIENKKTKGFPYTYSILVTYIFRKDSLALKVDIKNTDSKTFPFTLGWHPYFISKNLSESNLSFDCKERLIIGDRNITTGTENIQSKIDLEIKEQKLDDCWILNTDKIVFNTPNYQLNFQSSVKENFLQAYTPPRANTIAIEPTTGVSNSFNNKIGLQTLPPKKEYSITWKINIIND